jgi:hypothetical protein
VHWVLTNNSITRYADVQPANQAGVIVILFRYACIALWLAAAGVAKLAVFLAVSPSRQPL